MDDDTPQPGQPSVRALRVRAAPSGHSLQPPPGTPADSNLQPGATPPVPALPRPRPPPNTVCPWLPGTPLQKARGACSQGAPGCWGQSPQMGWVGASRHSSGPSPGVQPGGKDEVQGWGGGVGRAGQERKWGKRLVTRPPAPPPRPPPGLSSAAVRIPSPDVRPSS